MATIWFLVGGAVFLVALSFGLRHWWHRLSGIHPAARITLIATTVGGMVGAPFWWLDVEAAFSWDLPPLASRLLGAAAVAFAAAGLFVLRRPHPARTQAHALLTAAYLGPLAIAILALHLERFDFAAPITWGFFAAVLTLIATSLTALAVAGIPGLARRATGIEAAWLLFAGLTLVAWGLALFGVPATPFRMVFVWPADPLTSRLIAAMLLTVGLTFFLARRDSRLLPQARLFGAVYGLGVSVAVLGNVARGLPWPELYLGAMLAVGLVSTGFLIALRR